MTKHLFYILILHLTLNVEGQNRFKIKNPDHQLKALYGEPVLFQSVRSILQIFDSSWIEIESFDSITFNDSQTQYTLLNERKIAVLSNSLGRSSMFIWKNDVADTFNIRTVVLPPPTLSICDFRTHWTNFRSIDSVWFLYEPYERSVQCQFILEHFTIKIYPPKNQFWLFKWPKYKTRCIGNQVPEKIRNANKRVVPGTRVVISKIRVRSCTGERIKLRRQIFIKSGVY